MIKVSSKQGKLILVVDAIAAIDHVLDGRVLLQSDVVQLRGAMDGLREFVDVHLPTETEPDPIPFTIETWPKQVVYLRAGPTDSQGIMFTKVADWGISTGTHDYLWAELFNLNEMSIDFCQTWQPCKYVPGRGE